MKHAKTFKNCARSYAVEVLRFQYQTRQLNITKNHVKNLFKEFLADIRGFKDQITLQITFCKEIQTMKQIILHQFSLILMLKQ